VTGLRQYGFLGGVGARVILGLEDAGRVVQLVAKELEGRGEHCGMAFQHGLTLGRSDHADAVLKPGSRPESDTNKDAHPSIYRYLIVG
jgi:hypothetical protein